MRRVKLFEGELSERENGMINGQERLAIFMPSLRGGGAERSMINLAVGIAGRGYAMDLVLAQAEGPFLADVADAVRVVDLGASRLLKSLPALMRYLRRERPVAMLAVMSHANIVALWARRLVGGNVRLVVSERNTHSAATRHVLDLRTRLMPHLIRSFYSWADGIVAVSNGVADDLAQLANIPRRDIQVIFNPIVTHELHEKAKATLNHAWFNPGQPPVLLAVGRLTRQKDFPTLIQAFGRVRASRPVRLMILGEGTDRPQLELLVKQLGLDQDIDLAGFVENPYPYMIRASLFVLSSKWEGLPGALIEALFCGTPVIATDCPSGPREILEGGKYGEMVPVGNVAALAEAIDRSLNQEPPRPSRKSWQRFESEISVNKYISLLLGCL